MGKIIKLDEHLSNKIAAGEVVERPASVIKELVENAIDANSTRIEVEIEDGGLSLIRLTDNGEGMDREDCELAFHRHATSKIKNEHDLFHIRTLGFRGEALPSIASVSKLELKTSTGDGPGTYVLIQGGTWKEVKTTSSRKGTEITVTNLFYNTPARLKYMKTVQTELGNITDVLNRQALAHPEVAFRLVHNGKRVLQTNGSGDLLQVIAAVYGISTAKQMISISGRSLDFEVDGFLGKPEITRASRQYISIFINGRYLKNYPIFKAIQAGYHTLLPIGRYPIAVLNINMDPTLIDVNVHPSKLEARLSKEEELTALIEDSIKAAFKKIQLIPEPVKPREEIKKIAANSQKPEQQSIQFQHLFNRINNEEQDTTAEKKGLVRSILFNEAKKDNDLRDLQDLEKVKSTSSKTEPEVFEEYDEQAGDEQDTTYEEPIQYAEDIHEKEEEEPKHRIPPLYPIGQMHGTYILAQNENGLYIIDQHAAQERLKYEYYREKVGQVHAEVQELLVPLTFEFSKAEAAIIEEHLEQLKSVGVFLEPFGGNTYIVRSHPQWFPRGQEKETIEEMIEQVIAAKKVDVKKMREEAAIMMSCKGSIKANRYLRDDEIFSLLESLRKAIDPFTCPHGRPILIHFSTYDMEKLFKRVM
ncbi:DNA mismatch repair endonuclease MutL [Bacillus taeanensis]|uniref:DNA mismatch repair protein MutL n=1 Tax=Bacillus taeanensis TaxID=273032 RepID=A0A366XUG7_9BACI|nr:DNA mismatch repair endonuclease MutL [Bacillus taeanensis]RBW70020.1 DNA mismatch repair endonuclease MutL [Bacillus taeanensis]